MDVPFVDGIVSRRGGRNFAAWAVRGNGELIWFGYEVKGPERRVWMGSGESVGLSTCAILLIKTMVMML